MIFRLLCRRYHWTPDVVWGLSIPELRMYLVRDDKKRPAPPGGLKGVVAKLNADRAARGLPPIPIVEPGGAPPAARK